MAMTAWQIAFIVSTVLLVATNVSWEFIYHKEKYDTPQDHVLGKLAAFNPKVIKAFMDWKIKFDVKESDPDMEAYKLEVFANNYKTIMAHPKDATYTVAINKFAGLT
jgi:hypothetical protein